MATDEDIEIARYIMAILQNRAEIMMSWGIDPKTVKTITDGLQFHVQGFKITGIVKITYDQGSDLFRIDIIPDNDTPQITHEEVFLDQLVSLIDEEVEKTDDYQKRICEEYGFITHV